jgi:hypothetical protein
MHHTPRNALDYAQLKKLIRATDPTCMTYQLKIAEVREQLNLSYDCEVISLNEWRSLLRTSSNSDRLALGRTRATGGRRPRKFGNSRISTSNKTSTRRQGNMGRTLSLDDLSW